MYAFRSGIDMGKSTYKIQVAKEQLPLKGEAISLWHSWAGSMVKIVEF